MFMLYYRTVHMYFRIVIRFYQLPIAKALVIDAVPSARRVTSVIVGSV